jgi:hypothetical protein
MHNITLVLAFVHREAYECQNPSALIVYQNHICELDTVTQCLQRILSCCRGGGDLSLWSCAISWRKNCPSKVKGSTKDVYIRHEILAKQKPP